MRKMGSVPDFETGRARSGELNIHFRRLGKAGRTPGFERVHPLAFVPMALVVPVIYALMTPLALFTLDSGSWETRGHDEVEPDSDGRLPDGVVEVPASSLGGVQPCCFITSPTSLTASSGASAPSSRSRPRASNGAGSGSRVVKTRRVCLWAASRR